MNEREAPLLEPNGEGKEVLDCWAVVDVGSEYGLVPEMTSEMEGRDCRFDGSISSVLRASVVDVPLEVGG